MIELLADPVTWIPISVVAAYIGIWGIEMTPWWKRGQIPTWCAGCDQNQPAASMKFTEIGLYRCSVCRDTPKLLDEAKNLHTKNWAESLDRWGTVTCQCPTCQKLPEDRKRMQSLQRCCYCGEPARIIAGKAPWCEPCYDQIIPPQKPGARGQFTPIRDNHLEWKCQCGKLAEYYEWETGKRYCKHHMLAAPMDPNRGGDIFERVIAKHLSVQPGDQVTVTLTEQDEVTKYLYEITTNGPAFRPGAQF